jgi:hypothetical protein
VATRGASVDVEVVGMRETLAALRELDPAIRRQTLAEMRKAAQPLAAAVSAAIPADAPLSGMARGRMAYSSRSRKVTAKTGGRKSKSRDSWPLLRVATTSYGAAVFDMAGKGSSGSGSGATLIANLTSRYGSPSRAVWPAAERMMPEVTKAVVAACDRAAAQVNTKLDVRPRGR